MARLLKASNRQYNQQLTRVERTAPTIAPESMGQLWYDYISNVLYLGVGRTEDSWEVIGGLEQLQEYSSIPTGFKDNSKAETSYDDSTRTFTIQPKSPATFYEVSVGANFYVKAVAETKVWTDTTGVKYFYFDDDGVLQVEETPTKFGMIIANYAICGMLYWNATLSEVQLFAENEMHEAVLPPTTHAYLHSFFGCQYSSGLAISDITIGSGASEDDWKYKVATGRLYDEDIGITIPDYEVTNSIATMYKLGTEWVVDDSFNRVVNGGTGRLMFNKNGTALTEVPTGDFMLMFLIANNDSTNKVLAVLGQYSYSNSADLRANAGDEINNLITEGLPSEEFKFIGAVAYQTSDSYSNSTKSRIVQIDGSDYIDYRTSTITGSRTTVSDHGALSGLSDDDHKQYALLSGRSGDVLKMDTINEFTADNGVVVDGVTIKDGSINAPHDNLSSISGVGSGITYGHISDQAQTIAGAKTFSDNVGVGISPDSAFEVLQSADSVNGGIHLTSADDSKKTKLSTTNAGHFRIHNISDLKLFDMNLSTGETYIYGKVLVGGGTDTGYAYSYLNVGNFTQNGALTIFAKNTGNAYLMFGDADADYPGYIYYSHSENRMSFRTNEATVDEMTIHDSGIVSTPYQSGGKGHLSSNQLFTSGAPARVAINTKLYDKQSELDITTNIGRITLDEDGSYVFDGFVLAVSVTTFNTGQLYFMVNGTRVTPYFEPTSNDDKIYISYKDDLTAGDYVELWFSHSEGSDRSISAGTIGSYVTWNKIA